MIGENEECIYNIIIDMDTSQSPGVDGISPKMKEIAEEISDPLAIVFNLSIAYRRELWHYATRVENCIFMSYQSSKKKKPM